MHKNENRPGYKKTKVGWIPEGWECKQLAKTGLQVIDGDRGNNYPSQSDFFPIEHCLFLNAGNVTSDGFRFTEKQFISRERDALLRKGKLKRGDLVVTTRGTIGNFAHYTEDVPYEHVRINSGMAIIRNASDKISPSFIWKYFHSSIFDKELRRVTFGSAIPQLTIGLIQKFPIPVSPSLPEQEAIAKVLECWDKGIRTLENKIVKKRLIKKGLMQKLLSGQTRLSSFSKPWKTVKLGKISAIQKGQQLSRIDQTETGEYPVLNGGVEPLGYTDKWNAEANTVTISEGGNSCGFVTFNSKRFWCGGHCYALNEDKNKTHKSYLFQYLKHKQVSIMRLRVGSGLPNIQKKALEHFEIALPPLEEQRAIAEVLTAADGEIEALEKKLVLWKDQKKFLLNNLVTGTIRLPEFV